MNFRKSVGSLTDERVKITSEVIKGMRAIKMYAWEKPFSEIIKESRRYNMTNFVTAIKTSHLMQISQALIIFYTYVALAILFLLVD